MTKTPTFFRNTAFGNATRRHICDRRVALSYGPRALAVILCILCFVLNLHMSMRHASAIMAPQGEQQHDTSKAVGTQAPNSAAVTPQRPPRDAETEHLLGLIRAGMQANLDLIKTLDVDMEEVERSYSMSGDGTFVERTIQRRFWFDGVRWRVKWASLISPQGGDVERLMSDEWQEYVFDGEKTHTFRGTRRDVIVKPGLDAPFVPDKGLDFGYRLGGANWERILEEVHLVRTADDSTLKVHWTNFKASTSTSMKLPSTQRAAS